jgi:hypothetical protein
MSNTDYDSHFTNTPTASPSADLPSLAQHSITAPAADITGQHLHAVLSAFLAKTTEEIQARIHRAKYRRLESAVVWEYERSHRQIVDFVKELWTLVSPATVIRDEHARVIVDALHEVKRKAWYGEKEIKVATKLALAAFINSLPSEVTERPSRLQGEELYPPKT